MYAEVAGNTASCDSNQSHVEALRQVNPVPAFMCMRYTMCLLNKVSKMSLRHTRANFAVSGTERTQAKIPHNAFLLRGIKRHNLFDMKNLLCTSSFFLLFLLPHVTCEHVDIHILSSKHPVHSWSHLENVLRLHCHLTYCKRRRDRFPNENQ